MATLSIYTGGNDKLDKTIAKYSAAYKAAKSAGNAQAMQEANDAANQSRNAAGYAAESANADIASVSAANQGSGSSSSGSSYQGAAAYQPSDYSRYVKDLYAAKTDSALAALKSAYDDHVSDLDAAEQKITPAYQAARNETAAASGLEKQNFQEYAAARDLNAGASGQAELARSAALQGNLNRVNTQEADAKSDLALQRTKLASEYSTAIAKAKADGDYELAGALCTEKIRVDSALSAASDKQATYDYNKWKANDNVYQNAQTRADHLAAQNAAYARKDAAGSRETAYNVAMATLKSGNMPPDSVLNQAGIDKTSAQYLAAYYKSRSA